MQPWDEKLNITPVFNVAYSPEFNPIEAAFSKVKRIFNQRRLNCLVNKIGFNADKEINKALNGKNHQNSAQRRPRISAHRTVASGPGR